MQVNYTYNDKKNVIKGTWSFSIPYRMSSSAVNLDVAAYKREGDDESTKLGSAPPTKNLDETKEIAGAIVRISRRFVNDVVCSSLCTSEGLSINRSCIHQNRQISQLRKFSSVGRSVGRSVDRSVGRSVGLLVHLLIRS